MAKSIKCSDVGVDCDWGASAATFCKVGSYNTRNFYQKVRLEVTKQS
ncbi:MAG: hypothetical protein HY295_01410 [Thaumarchaeota archaeon]|nr:hypothetical protein [Nitrososphaerota archaeon]